MIHWLTTSPNPKSSARGCDAGQRGWRLHAVEAAEENLLPFVGVDPLADLSRAMVGVLTSSLTRSAQSVLRYCRSALDSSPPSPLSFLYHPEASGLLTSLLGNCHHAI